MEEKKETKTDNICWGSKEGHGPHHYNQAKTPVGTAM